MFVSVDSMMVYIYHIVLYIHMHIYHQFIPCVDDMLGFITHVKMGSRFIADGAMALPGPIHRRAASLSLELPGRFTEGTLMISHQFHTNVVCFS